MSETILYVVCLLIAVAGVAPPIYGAFRQGRAIRRRQIGIGLGPQGQEKMRALLSGDREKLVEAAEREADAALREATSDLLPIKRPPDPLLEQFEELEEAVRQKRQSATWKRAARGEFRTKRRP